MAREIAGKTFLCAYCTKAYGDKTTCEEHERAEHVKVKTLALTCWGPVRGSCGIAHASLERAEACCARDGEGCSEQGGYSDRSPHVSRDESGSACSMGDYGIACTCDVESGVAR